jgi:hypothetical protein
MVGERGFEPPTPWSRTRCSTRLSHSPMDRCAACSFGKKACCNARIADCFAPCRNPTRAGGEHEMPPNARIERASSALLIDSTSDCAHFPTPRRERGRLAIQPGRFTAWNGTSRRITQFPISAPRLLAFHRAVDPTGRPDVRRLPRPSSGSLSPSADPRFPNSFRDSSASPSARSR